MQRRGEPFLEIEDVTIDERDVEALRGIAEHGSMHRAASELGRSYARIQQRITELEETLGSLITRERGGKGGGGSTLTAKAYRLLARFDRLCAEFAGLSRTEETVFSGTLIDREGMLGTVETAAGPVRAIVTTDAETIQVSIRSDAIALMVPDEAPHPAGTSVCNQFQGRITHIKSEDGIARVTVDVGADASIRTLITQTSLDTLGVIEGETVVASFKATATHAVPEPDTYNGRQGNVL